MSIQERLESMTEEERILYLSAKQVKESAFWKHMMNQLDAVAMDNNQKMLTKLMSGDEKAAVVAGAHIQAIGEVIRIMYQTIHDVEDDLTIGQEE